MDFAFGAITPTALRATVCTFTWPYREEKFGILGKKPSLLPKWGAIFWPFSIETWSCIAGAVVVFTPVLWLSAKIAREEQQFTLIFCFMSCLKSLFSQGKTYY